MRELFNSKNDVLWNLHFKFTFYFEDLALFDGDHFFSVFD